MTRSFGMQEIAGAPMIGNGTLEPSFDILDPNSIDHTKNDMSLYCTAFARAQRGGDTRPSLLLFCIEALLTLYP